MTGETRMSGHLRRFVLCLLNILLMTSLTGSVQDPQSGMIRGVVLDDSNGRPLANVSIVVRGARPPVRILTDNEGRFLIEKLPLGSPLLICTLAGGPSLA